MRRRRVFLTAAVSIAAVALGAAVGWWRIEPNAVAPAATDALFAATFPDADGTKQPIAQWRDRVLVVNFWATWCAPCVEEMPDLQAVRQIYSDRGVEVIGIGIDNADSIRKFRDKLGLHLPLLVAGLGGSDLNRALGNDAGVLPYTVVVGRDGQVRARHTGRVKRAQLERWIQRALN